MKLRHITGSGLALLPLVAGILATALAAPLCAQLPKHHAVVGCEHTRMQQTQLAR